MANLQKYTRSSLGHILLHFSRGKDKNGETVKYRNQNIDLRKTPLNYNLAPDRENVIDFIKERCSQVYCLNRNDVNVLCSWVVTLPKDALPGEEKYFFQAVYDFLENRYGKENVVSSYVHMDETTPHMHFAFIPVTYEKKKERETVSAKMLIDKKELSRFHPELSKAVEKAFGRKLEIMTGEHGDLSLEQFKQMKANEETIELQQQKIGSLKVEMEFLREIETVYEHKVDEIKNKAMNIKGRDDLTAIPKDIFNELLTIYANNEAIRKAVRKASEYSEYLMKYSPREFNKLAYEAKALIDKIEIYEKFFREHPEINRIFENSLENETDIDEER